MVSVLAKIMGQPKLMPITKESKGRKKIKVRQRDFVEKDLFKQN